MKSLLTSFVLLLVLVLVLEGRAQTFTEGDIQVSRKAATAGFAPAELTFGTGLTTSYNAGSKTITIATGTGTTSISTLGTITTGTWNATPIANAYIASAATWNAKLDDGDTLTTGLTFPITGFKIQTEDTGLLTVAYNGSLADNQTLSININNADREINLSGHLTVSGPTDISGTNTGDITLAGSPNYLTLTGQTLTRSLINLGTHVTGTLPAAHLKFESIRTVSTSTAAASTDRTILVDASAGSVTITLPAVASSNELRLNIKALTTNAGANTITIDPNGTETIDGSAASLTTTTAYTSWQLHCNGSAWYLIK